MLAPRLSLLSNSASPRICIRCLQRCQSTTTPSHESTPDSVVSPNRPIPSRQQYQSAIPSYPSATPKAPPPSQNAHQADRSFHPALTGFITGAMLSLGGAILAYYLSGSAQLVKASHERHAHLTTRRKELFPPSQATGTEAGGKGVMVGGREGNVEDVVLGEAEAWFRDTAFFYAAYVPGAEAYLTRNAGDVGKARATPQGAVAVYEIIKNCAYELERLIGGGQLGLMVGKQAWAIVHKHLEMVVDVAEEGRDVPEEIRKKVGKQLEGLKRVGSRAGRQERRLLEEKAMSGEGKR